MKKTKKQTSIKPTTLAVEVKFYVSRFTGTL